MKKNVNELFFKCSALLICSYLLDVNKNYKTYLTNDKIKKCLKSYQVGDEIINYTNANYNLTGKVYYLRNSADSECMILFNSKTIYLIFCGTQTEDKFSLFRDLITDISFGLKNISEFGKNIGIHHPYVQNMNNQNLIGQIEKIVLKYLNIDIDMEVVICGHSMGCGLALYTSMVLEKKITNIKIKLITIEAPKLGNKELKKYLINNPNIKHYDMINNNDFALCFPFIMPNYCHIADKTYLFSNESIVKIKKNISGNIFTNHSIKDHFLNNIIKNIYDVLVQ
jgi:predicted lipase